MRRDSDEALLKGMTLIRMGQHLQQHYILWIAIIAESLFIGLEAAVKKMKALLAGQQ